MGIPRWEGDGGMADLQWPVSHPQATTDVSQLLSTLMAGLRMGTPCINTFSGDATLGKTKVSFKHWYHKVMCVKDHCQEVVIWESTIHSLKGARVDMARYLGPTTSVDHILCKLSVILGTVASFNVFMQDFIKWARGVVKVPSFATRLEGTLNQMDLEAWQHIRDHLFHGVRKHIHNSAQYLYSTPDISYSQLMVAA